MQRSVKNTQSVTKVPPVEALVYFAFACLAVWMFVLVPTQVGKPVTLFGAPPDGLDPRTLPKLVLLGIAAIGVIGALSTMRNSPTEFTRPTLNVGITCVASFVFAAVLVPLGFVFASALTVVGLACILGGRHILALCLAGFVVPLGIYLAFTRLLHIALPSGILGI